ncbi:MAG: hypothetical protein ACK40E_03955 [Caldimicrobium sp.]
MKRSSGFLLIEVLIASLILSTSIAASFYLFRMGFSYLKKAEESNFFARMLPQAVSYLVNVAELETHEGKVSLGQDSELIWKATLDEKIKPNIPNPEGGFYQPYELYLYKVDFSIRKGELQRDYQVKIMRYKILLKVEIFE